MYCVLSEKKVEVDSQLKRGDDKNICLQFYSTQSKSVFS